MDAQRCYLGDGVYTRLNSNRVILSTDNGIQKTNEIIFEPEVLAVFLLWLEQNGMVNKFEVTDEAKRGP